MFTYTFIIPHKNIPSLLKRCIDSIPNQNDIEIIVVDDNSNNESVIELKKLSHTNLRIIYTHENKGAGYARNIGIKSAHGKWILFADADDFFLPNILELIDLYKDEQKPLILFKSVCRDSNKLNNEGNRQWLCDMFSKNMELFKEGKINSINLILGHGVPWAKMVQLNFLKNKELFFDEIKFGNDIGWITRLALCTHDNDIVLANKALYCLTDRDSSLYHSQTPEALYCRFTASYHQHITLKSNDIPSSFNYLPFVVEARKMGPFFLLIFIKFILKNLYRKSAIYKIEKRLHLKKPYLYVFIQIIKVSASLPLSFLSKKHVK